MSSLRWRHNERDSVSNHQPHDCLLNRLFRRRSKKISKLRVTGLCEGNSPVTGEFPAQMASYEENVSIWWRHHVCHITYISDMITQPTKWKHLTRSRFTFKTKISMLVPTFACWKGQTRIHHTIFFNSHFCWHNTKNHYIHSQSL